MLSAPVKLGLNVIPGDHVSGKVTVNGSQVTVSLSDQTSGAAMTRTLSMSNPDTSTAEWIAEAPSSCDQTSECQPLPLADFGNVSFTGASATAGGHTGSISDSQWMSSQVALNGGADEGPGFVVAQTSTAAQPSSLSTDGSAFSVAYSSDANASGGEGATTNAAGGAGYGYGGSGYGGYGYGGSGYGAYGYGVYGYGVYGYGVYGYGAYGYGAYGCGGHGCGGHGYGGHGYGAYGYGGYGCGGDGYGGYGYPLGVGGYPLGGYGS